MLIPLLFIISGLFIRYQIGRRRFNRRSVAGVQLFSSYFTSILIVVLETLINIAGALLVIAGLIKLLIKL